jgi:hypothetical protein
MVKEFSPRVFVVFLQWLGRRRVVRSVSHFACQEGYLTASWQATSLSLACRDVVVLCYESLLPNQDCRDRLAVAESCCSWLREQHKKATRRLLGRHPTLAEDENTCATHATSEIILAASSDTTAEKIAAETTTTLFESQTLNADHLRDGL